ncbi:unnamed protein product, partial [Cladocopium goreaui]
VDGAGDIVAAGYTVSSGFDGQTNNNNIGHSDLMLMKLSSAGAHQWTVLRGGSTNEFAYSLKVDSSDAILVGGYSDSTDLDSQSNAGGNDVMVMKFSSAGAHQWTVLRGGSGNEIAYALE